MNIVNIRNYIIILLALVILVAGITTLLYFYNQILDSVFVGHKAIQSDGNLINFFEKTFGLAVTILVSSVALVIALLSVRIMRQQTTLIEKQTEFSQIQADMSRQQNEFSQIQTELSQRQNEIAVSQHNFEASFRVNDFVKENFAGTIEVYERVNSIFLSMSLIRNLQYKHGVNFKKDGTQEYDPEYDAAVNIVYDQLIDDTERLMSLVRLRARDNDFDTILDYCSSNRIQDFAPIIDLRYRSTKDSKTRISRSALYVCLFEYWKNNVNYPKKEIYVDLDVGVHEVVIYQTYRQDNVAIEIASANFKDIIHAVDEIRHITHDMYFDIKDYPDSYKGSYTIVPHIILAAIVLYSPDRILQSLDSDIANDTFYLKLLWETMERRIPYHSFIFKINNEAIYPGYSETIENIISKYTLIIKSERDPYWQRNHTDDYDDENDNEEYRAKQRAASKNFMKRLKDKKLELQKQSKNIDNTED